MSPKISNDQKEQRRLQILEAAKHVFSLKGYGAATLKDIVIETGMSRGWIYLYFQTKEEIFEALMDHQDEEYDKKLEDALAMNPRIWPIINNQINQLKEELCLPENESLLPAFYEYFLTGWRDEEIRALLLQRYENGINRLSGLLQKGIDKGEFNPAKPVTDIARMISSYQEGIITLTVAVGAEMARTTVQLEEMSQYFYRLLNPSLDG
ncbi:putative HTH-type transcriptional regulator YfiR [Paenibacillus glycanilyticus]|uniref:HTH-type transcriptional regulator YfiR n=1 Tax=Paenibacillus glycanilyticus TaxID=126569 RepID=A0ABQ6NMY1_9BACL|nr:TetR family transcriptional regulator [Paenibacillus glycanilyticus]GMK46134.1 putative HTH-type transcriptional regulator YfiR [Paenibacillus glycanilyticus]